ncbi:2-hydroxychromene-2-carboxylate isomerase [Cupriavidus basilensis]|uniref:2-hydroxychromene-2-carboxylate isomerase n=1 Tax=Cupriavidus basilensis TaxID=68895 RepID=A0ABT6AQV1_9BURK|nr:2-hydroxychromene-2-carboxylate isomerase [Cupriavidus basilensis]MDF3834116.1 2-hydroxychromene-2-carboxylate isomerase [Cupriavidus basilensis]
MTTAIDWYFDPISPFAYLAFERLPKALPADAAVRYVPVLFAGLLRHWGNVGPAEIAPKRRFTFEHVAWIAHRGGIRLAMPAIHPFNPLPLLRLAVALELEGRLSHATLAPIFRFVWQQGRVPQQQAEFDALCSALGVPGTALAQDAVKARLREHGDEALARGVFGVPTAVLPGDPGGQLFWGLDALDMLAARLGQDPFFSSDAFRAAAALPVGAGRADAPAPAAAAGRRNT